MNPEIDDTEQFGWCDTCNEPYELSSLDGRCGDCGDCGECCIHVEENGEVTVIRFVTEIVVKARTADDAFRKAKYKLSELSPDDFYAEVFERGL